MVKMAFWGFKITKIDFTQNLSGRKVLEFRHCMFPIRLPRSVFCQIEKKKLKLFLNFSVKRENVHGTVHLNSFRLT